MKLSAEEKRGYTRTPHHELISFSINKTSSPTPPDVITAQVIDISATGIGITTDLLLSKKQVIQFEKNQPNWELPENGLIIWSYKHNSTYRAGIEFITPGGE